MNEKYSSQHPLSKIYNFLIAWLWESRQSDYLTQSLLYTMTLLLKDLLEKEKREFQNDIAKHKIKQIEEYFELTSDQIEDFEYFPFIFLPYFTKEEKIAKGFSILKKLTDQDHEMMSISIEYFINEPRLSILDRDVTLARYIGRYLNELDPESIVYKDAYPKINLDIVISNIIKILNVFYWDLKFISRNLDNVLKECEEFQSENAIQNIFSLIMFDCFTSIDFFDYCLDGEVNGYIKLLRNYPKSNNSDISKMQQRFEELVGKINSILNVGHENISSYNNTLNQSNYLIMDQIKNILRKKLAQPCEFTTECILKIKKFRKELIKLHDEIVPIAESFYGFHYSEISDDL